MPQVPFIPSPQCYPLGGAAYRDEDVVLFNGVIAPADGTAHEMRTLLVTDRGPLRVRVTATNNADGALRRFVMVCRSEYRKWAERVMQALPPRQRRARMFAKRFASVAVTE